MIFTVDQFIEAAPETVWFHLSDPTKMAAWMPGVSEFKTGDGGPVAAGSRLMFTARGSERRSTVTEFEPGRAMTLQSTQNRFTATYRYTIEPAGDGTRVRLAVDCRAEGPIAILSPLIRFLIRRADSGQLRHLRAAVLAGVG